MISRTVQRGGSRLFRISPCCRHFFCRCISRGIQGNLLASKGPRIQEPLIPSLQCFNDELQPSPTLSSALNSRSFSSTAAEKQQRKGENYRRQVNGGLLVNEHLIQALLKDGKLSAEELRVRLVVDVMDGTPSTIEVVSLIQAIKTSHELDVDLIGIRLDQDPPVVKAQDYAKAAYKSSKKATGSGRSSSPGKATKEFKFKAGIAEHDLTRKVQDMVSYLRKGHCCQIIVTSSRRNLRLDPDAIMTTLKRVRNQIGTDGLDDNPIKTNDTGTYATLFVQPNSKQ